MPPSREGIDDPPLEISRRGSRGWRGIGGRRQRSTAGQDSALNRSAADRSDNRPIIANEHLRRLKGWNRSAHIDDGRHRAAPASLAQADNFFVDVHCVII